MAGFDNLQYIRDFAQGGTVKKSVTFRLDPDLYAEAQAFASKDNRSVTNFVETLLIRHMRGGAAPDASGQTDGWRQPAAGPTQSSQSKNITTSPHGSKGRAQCPR
jgi:hypothetical protein